MANHISDKSGLIHIGTHQDICPGANVITLVSVYALVGKTITLAVTFKI